jgi:hypothetical protein
MARRACSIVLLLFTLGMLSACSDALVYGESTNFSLASVKFNDNVARPFSVNVGLDRTVAALVPPMGTGDESANLIAGFRLTDDSNAPFGTKTITTTFASGRAGEVLAGKQPELALRIMRIGEFQDDRYSRCIDDWVEAAPARRADRVAVINAWWDGQRKGTADTSAHLRYDAQYAAARKRFVSEQNIPCH